MWPISGLSLVQEATANEIDRCERIVAGESAEFLEIVMDCGFCLGRGLVGKCPVKEEIFGVGDFARLIYHMVDTVTMVKI